MSEQKEFETREPHEGEFFRTHPDPAYRQEAMMIEVGGELYVVADNMIDEVEKVKPGRMKKYMIFTAVNMEGKTFLWPVPAPVPVDHPAFQAIDYWVAHGIPERELMDQLEHLHKPKTKH